MREHLPLRVSEMTPSQIYTATGRGISLSWVTHPADNPYEEAEQFAAFIVRAVNSHDELVEALRAALEWIDAVPADTPLPAMPGFNRDEVNALLDRAALAQGEKK